MSAFEFRDRVDLRRPWAESKQIRFSYVGYINPNSKDRNCRASDAIIANKEQVIGCDHTDITQFGPMN
jgi:hypothetical protein